MRVSDFHFDLPENLIAQHPPATRGSSRMLVLDRATGALTDSLFQDLPQLLQPGDLLILNDSRVLPARLFATRANAHTQPTSARPTPPTGLIEVLLTEQIEDPAENLWRALVRPARKLRPGDTLHFHAPAVTSRNKDAVIPSEAPERAAGEMNGAQSRDPRITPGPAPLSTAPLLTAQVIASGEFGERTLRFAPTPDFYATLDRIGHMPLPPYIRRQQSTAADSPEDRERYQTVYSQKAGSQKAGSQKAGAHHPGSAAAPTAGLHFTPEVLTALTARGVEIAYLTLHVGLGTFQPVRVSELKDIRLHSERYTLPAATADALNRALHPPSGQPHRRIIAVGTTTTRTLEHIAQAHIAQGISQPATRNLQPATLSPHSGSTSIFLAPGHRFRIVSGLLTNFHLPESTLLMLAAAFTGDAASGAPSLDPETWELPLQDPDRGRQTILRAYTHAIHARYRFYSYGDCMLLL